MSVSQKALDQRILYRDQFTEFARDCLTIRTKGGDLEPFRLNRAQTYIHDRLEAQKAATGRVRAIILKGRQQGCSTYVEGRFYHQTIHRKGVRTFILAHEKESTGAIYEMARRYHEYCPQALRPSTGTSNAKELVFDKLDSGYKVGTAGNESVGRGTTLQYFHGSEVAFWPARSEGELTKGIIQAVPDAPDTEIIYESTANGPGNFFHSETLKALRGEGDYQLIFVPWYWQEEYVRPAGEDFTPSTEEHALMEGFGLVDGYKLSAEQIMWRRAKITELTTAIVDGLKAFRQEYPNNVTEAFQFTGVDGMIKAELVEKARKARVKASRLLVVGVDPSRGGDRFGVIRRAGRKLFKPEAHTGDIDLGRAVQICKKVLDEERPHRMFIDAGGGDALVDRLKELGYGKQVKAIPFGGRPLNPERYKNKRAEMWGEMAEWLADDLDVEVPDDDVLQADLIAPQCKRDSMDRIVMESKDCIRKRGLPSPDLGDAAALTFAEQVVEEDSFQNWSLPDKFFE